MLAFCKYHFAVSEFPLSTQYGILNFQPKQFFIVIL